MWFALLFACSLGTISNIDTVLDGVLTRLEPCDDLSIAILDPDAIVRLGLRTPTEEGGASLVAAAVDGPVSAEFVLPDPTITARLFFGGGLVGCAGGTDGFVDAEFAPIAGRLRIDVSDADIPEVTVTLDDAIFQLEGREDAGPTLGHGEWSATIEE
jgi:hypothetical protein